MKNKTALGHLICMITSDCQEDTEHKAEIGEENVIENETQQASKLDFHLFDIDEVFAN